MEKLNYLGISLFEACQSGKAEIVKLLLERLDTENTELNAKDKSTITSSFMLACEKGNTNIANLLLDYSANNIDSDAEIDDVIC